MDGTNHLGPIRQTDAKDDEHPVGYIDLDSTGNDAQQSPRPEASQVHERRASGPRTELGKNRSSQNATKHGIFSKVVVLSNESRAEYEELAKGLKVARQPKDALEKLLVEKLATTAWRQRRLLLAEKVKCEERNRERQWPLMLALANLERRLPLFEKLREQIKKDGFNLERDTAILKDIYGDRHEYRFPLDVWGTYVNCLVYDEDWPPEASLEWILQRTQDEINVLKYHQIQLKSDLLRPSILDAPELDRLLRYEMSLERAFDRTLNQLVHLQRMRKEQPALPLKVNVSAS